MTLEWYLFPESYKRVILTDGNFLNCQVRRRTNADLQTYFKFCVI